MLSHINEDCTSVKIQHGATGWQLINGTVTYVSLVYLIGWLKLNTQHPWSSRPPKLICIVHVMHSWCEVDRDNKNLASDRILL